MLPTVATEVPRALMCTPAKGMVTGWAITLQTSDFYGPPRNPQPRKPPMIDPPPRDIRLADSKGLDV